MKDFINLKFDKKYYIPYKSKIKKDYIYKPEIIFNNIYNKFFIIIILLLIYYYLIFLIYEKKSCIFNNKKIQKRPKKQQLVMEIIYIKNNY